MGLSSETKHLVGNKMKSEKDAVDEESVTDEEVSEFARVFAQLRGGRDWDQGCGGIKIGTVCIKMINTRTN